MIVVLLLTRSTAHSRPQRKCYICMSCLFFLRNSTVFQVKSVSFSSTLPCHWENLLHSLIPLEKWIIFVVFKWPQTISFFAKKAFNQHVASRAFVIRTLKFFEEQGNILWRQVHWSNILLTFWLTKWWPFFSTACNFLEYIYIYIYAFVYVLCTYIYTVLNV